MNTNSQLTIAINSILAAVGTSAHSYAALKAAVELAEVFGAKVTCLIGSGGESHSPGRLSFNPEKKNPELDERASHSSGHPTVPETETISEENFPNLARFIENNKNLSLVWKQVPGLSDNQILKASAETDLISLGRIFNAAPDTTDMDEVALSVINKAKKPVLLMQNGQTLGEIVLVVYDDSSESSKGLVTALELARKTDRELVVMVLDSETESLKDRDQTVDELMQRSDTRISVTFMKQTHIWAFMNFISRFPEGLLVIPKYQALVTQHPFEKFLNMIDRPILLAS